jgi:hypothetical protein
MPHGLDGSFADVDLDARTVDARQRAAVQHDLAIDGEVPAANGVVELAHLDVCARDGDTRPHVQALLLDLATEDGGDEMPVRVHADDRTIPA